MADDIETFFAERFAALASKPTNYKGRQPKATTAKSPLESQPEEIDAVKSGLLQVAEATLIARETSIPLFPPPPIGQTHEPKTRKRRYIPPRRINVTEGTIYEVPHAELTLLLETEFGLLYDHDPGFDNVRKLYTRYPNRRYYAYQMPEQRPTNSEDADYSLNRPLNKEEYYQIRDAVSDWLSTRSDVSGAAYVLETRQCNDETNPKLTWIIVMMTEYCTHSKFDPSDIASWELFPEK